ncbi:hypothetical protein ES704_01376 [subsurface metagenome]|jgi:hypothetical protein
MNYTKGEWEVKRLPITGGVAIYAGNDLIAGGLEEANAQLIASAPDLYEALRKCAEAINMLLIKYGNGVLSEESTVYKKAKKALAKAEGK